MIEFDKNLKSLIEAYSEHYDAYLYDYQNAKNKEDRCLYYDMLTSCNTVMERYVKKMVNEIY